MNELITKAIAYGYHLGCSDSESGTQGNAETIANESLSNFVETTEGMALIDPGAGSKVILIEPGATPKTVKGGATDI